MQPTSQMIRAHKEVVLGAVKRGDADCTYAFLGGGGVSIQNANSAEELNQRLMGSPLGSTNSTYVPSRITVSSWTPWPKPSKSKAARSRAKALSAYMFGRRAAAADRFGEGYERWLGGGTVEGRFLRLPGPVSSSVEG